MRKHIFNAGPCVLPVPALEKTAEAVRDFNGIGQSILEVSHRSKDFEAVINEAVALMKELLAIPEGYSVLWLGGGASTQFAMVPYNLMQKKSAYLNTGEWASKAIKEAKGFGEVVVVGSSEDGNFSYIPRGYEIPADADYFHITTNNTIFGTEIREDLDSPVPLIADMSSDIMSRPVDVSKYALIYGGAQKNLGPAGVTFVIIRNDIVGKVDRYIPTMMRYKTHIDKESMFNTPPCVNIFVVKEVLKWVKENGGVAEMERRAIEKANLLYAAIDESPVFDATVKDPRDRSLMNITFVLKDAYKEHEAAFIDFAKARGVVGIKGHRSVGGFRASCYNALEKESVQVLVQAMKDFEKNIG
ncbi:MAG: 3-phosphoserine/phosphohydroxythreonine transaminase [Lentimicrobiaceae bacterium]|nr:3-phosphoserine/phosphohydroxythreonine transaminase [Lentimicrobiaceae bacterium]